MPLDATHAPQLRSWVESANDPSSDFPIQNLPFACCRHAHTGPARLAIGVPIGDLVLLPGELVEAGLLDDLGPEITGRGDNLGCFLPGIDLEPFAALPAASRRALRLRLSELLARDTARLRDNGPLRSRALVPARDVEWEKPMHIFWNYTDFYASIQHATTVGSMFRPDNPLLPNYRWVPIGYHGRASSIVESGATIVRPRGQIKADDAPGDAMTPPVFGPTQMLDYELEVGCLVGPGNPLGHHIELAEADDHIAGLCLVNDWSARDIQKWEYQPLGPFLAKNFATSVSPFLVTLDALEPFRVPAVARGEGEAGPLPYLSDPDNDARGGFDITLEVLLRSAEMVRRAMPPVRLSRSRAFRDLYWTFGQMIAHHTSNGCNLNAGDLIASGTVSGAEPDSRGCLLERTWQGRGPDGAPLPRRPIELPTGETRRFLADGDEVILRGWCEREGAARIGFGECRGIIAPAR